jgi:hypothetical protein
MKISTKKITKFRSNKNEKNKNSAIKKSDPGNPKKTTSNVINTKYSIGVR